MVIVSSSASAEASSRQAIQVPDGCERNKLRSVGMMPFGLF